VTVTSGRSTTPPPRPATSRAESAARWPVRVRSLGDDDWADFVRVDAHAFGATMSDGIIAAERELHEPGRGIGAYDGPDLVGIATAFSYRLSVPGATVPAAAVSWVGVLPTHRRRGVLSALMAHQLEGIRSAGQEPIAILWASEPQIYGRFGYGRATSLTGWRVPRDAAALGPQAPVDPSVALRLVDPASWDLLAGVYATVARWRAGVPERDERWWRRAVRDLPDLRDGRSELRCVVAEGSDGGVRGYALYSTKQDWEDFGQGEVSVREVLATDPAALSALYRYLFDLDLMGSAHLWNLPVDDPLQHWLTNPRTAKPSLGDALYVRLVDLPGALSARTYTRTVDVVLEVTDRDLPDNAGRWWLVGDPGGATCTPTDDTPDLVMETRDLGAAYLGGTSLAELAAADRVREARDGALAEASSAFAVTPAPWSPAVF